jgi:hypothetical protein
VKRRSWWNVTSLAASPLSRLSTVYGSRFLLLLPLVSIILFTVFIKGYFLSKKKACWFFIFFINNTLDSEHD